MFGRDHGVRKTTLRRDQPERSEDTREGLQGNSERSEPIGETKVDAEGRNDLGSMEGDFVYHHHVEPRVQLHVPKEQAFPILLKYVTRTTRTNLDVLQEKTDLRLLECQRGSKIRQIHGQDSRSSLKSTKKLQKFKGRVVLRGDIVKDDSGKYAVFCEQGSSASQITAAKVMDVLSRPPGCAGQAAGAISAYTQVKMEDAPKVAQDSKVIVSRYMDTSSTTQVTDIMVTH